MTPNAMKGISIACFVLCAICLFFAYERYQDNASKVNAMNKFVDSTPLGGFKGAGKLEPATPAATKYALFFALISAGGGVVCLVVAMNKNTTQSRKGGGTLPS